MKRSIRTKLLLMCLVLVLLATNSVSIAYYLLSKQSMHRQSQQRIRIAQDIVLDDLNRQTENIRTRFTEYLRQDIKLNWITYFYNQKPENIGTTLHLVSYASRATDELKQFGTLGEFNRLMLFGLNKRLIAAYEHENNEAHVGAYTISATGKGSYLLFDDFFAVSQLHSKSQPIPDNPLPEGIPEMYAGELPEEIVVSMFRENARLGIRVIAPVYRDKTKEGVLVGDVFYTQAMLERYATLSETEVNFFAGQTFSIGTLPQQAAFSPDNIPACDELFFQTASFQIVSETVRGKKYFQGSCGFQTPTGVIGGMTINLPQEIEQQEMAKIGKVVVSILIIVVVLAVILSAFFSRHAIQTIHALVRVIGAASEGDLSQKAVVRSRDEFGMLAHSLNDMIDQLRHVSAQIQQSSSGVNVTADTILREMDMLIHRMEQQTASVDNTTTSFELIQHFVDVVAQNTSDLLSAASQILASIHETRASIEEVTTTTSDLANNMHLIYSSVGEFKLALSEIAERAVQLDRFAQQTGAETSQIEHALHDVSANAEQTRELASHTMAAATQGQVSVDASIQGILRLKDSVADTSEIIGEVNQWGERVSSILDIVDEITAQTSLLALNASIISAQAGSHGRGFAVVADEIKELANRTKSSTQEIGTLVHELQKKSEQGVKRIAEGMKNADEGVRLVSAVKDALGTILDSATNSSHRADHTAKVTQQTAKNSQTINASMANVAEMVSQIKTTLHVQEHDLEKVFEAIESISGMSEQLNRASEEQKRAAIEIAASMEDVTEKFSETSDQTGTLQHHATQIVDAMKTIETITDQILTQATTISNDAVRTLVEQSEALLKIIQRFKVG
ncbi:methyl-accepting chemotaxis sensory transducer [Candidatus Moduliflexus flocculans]|uniref:Methyl-accepting chemotaxis sensory transducer n=1 Tax=Candidatus Moduliflexus flocculans TaxID=1499966 RepID=A0A081BNL8_9BACT|nr:methyl-accepting chemotaxis sensory transducer [Candidatus Moduliflexus flocculans]